MTEFAEVFREWQLKLAIRLESNQTLGRAGDIVHSSTPRDKRNGLTTHSALARAEVSAGGSLQHFLNYELFAKSCDAVVH
jgi:hypothetical protein